MWHKLRGSKIANSGSVQWTCPEQMRWCSVQHRCNVYGACRGPELPCQWGQRDDDCSRVVHRRARTLISSGVLMIVKEGEAGVQPGAVAGTTDEWAWMKRIH